MNIDILGGSHLADTLRRAATIRGFTVYSDDPPELTFVAADVYDHDAVEVVNVLMPLALDDTHNKCPIIVLSQVPPGWTREWGEKHPNIFYQVDTIIMNNAVERMVHPEQIVVGCLKPAEPLPLDYQEYLLAFEAPVIKMSYESAELAKLAINHFLAVQVETTNVLSRVAEHIDADWNDVARVLHNDKRIGKYAYLRPGEINQHLKRDVSTIDSLWRKVLGISEKARG